jgi:arylsulfatase A-like enzyme
MVGSGSTNNPLINEEGYDGRTIRTARYRYTEWTPLNIQRDTLVELYDLEQDPMEYVNIKDEPAHANLVTELSERLAAGWQGELPLSSGS